MTVILEFGRETWTNKLVPTDLSELASGATLTTAVTSIVGRVLGHVSNTATGTYVTEQITASDYRPLSLPLVRSDFENALSLKEVLPSSSWETWDLDDFELKFRPQEAIKVKMTMRYVGKLPPSQIDADEDWLE